MVSDAAASDCVCIDNAYWKWSCRRREYSRRDGRCGSRHPTDSPGSAGLASLRPPEFGPGFSSMMIALAIPLMVTIAAAGIAVSGSGLRVWVALLVAVAFGGLTLLLGLNAFLDWREDRLAE